MVCSKKLELFWPNISVMGRTEPKSSPKWSGASFGILMAVDDVLQNLRIFGMICKCHGRQSFVIQLMPQIRVRNCRYKIGLAYLSTASNITHTHSYVIYKLATENPVKPSNPNPDSNEKPKPVTYSSDLIWIYLLSITS